MIPLINSILMWL